MVRHAAVGFGVLCETIAIAEIFGGITDPPGVTRRPFPLPWDMRGDPGVQQIKGVGQHRRGGSR